MRYQVEHRTIYRYDIPVIQSQQLLHMMPRETPYQKSVSYTLVCEPQPAEQSRRLDFFGNHNDYVTILIPHQSLQIISSFQVDVQPRPTMMTFNQSPAWEQVQSILQLQSTQHLAAMRYVYSTLKVKSSEALASFGRQCFI
jgi:transglutaminase-like putative cysteine protease